MVAILHNFRKHSNCECCDATDVDVHFTPVGAMWQCVNCRQKDVDVAERNKAVSSLLVQSAQVDASIQIKSDIFSAKTVAAIELRGAIEADESITDADKDYAFAKVCQERFLHLKQVIFEERKALVDKENEMRMWQVNAQSAAGRLREEKRAEFKAIDVTYEPKPNKAVDAAKASRGKSVVASQSKRALAEAREEAAKKYGVSEALIKMVMEGRKCTADEAGQSLMKAREERAAATASNS